MLNHMEFDKNEFRFSLTGSVITVFGIDGKKIRQFFYDNKEEARAFFFEIA